MFQARIAVVMVMMMIALNGRAFARDQCYAHDVVHVERHQAVWDEPGFYGRVITAVIPNAGYRVLASVPVGMHCWVLVRLRAGPKTHDAWLLNDDSTVEHLQEGVAQDIGGDVVFVKTIEQSLAYLREKVPYWHQYVTQLKYTIKPTKAGDIDSHADVSARRVSINQRHLVSEKTLARVLVHEACHIHQSDEDRLPLPGDWCGRVRAERECTSKELEMELDAEPGNRDVFGRFRLLRESDWWWWSTRRGNTGWDSQAILPDEHAVYTNPPSVPCLLFGS